MIDHATEADISALAEMLHPDRLPARVHIDGTGPDLCANFRAVLIAGSRILVYRTEGVPRACLIWTLAQAPGSAPDRPRRQAVLDHIQVQPIWRRRGLARRLIARFETDVAALGFSGWVTRVHAADRPGAAMMRAQGAHLAVQVYEKRFQAPA